ncbi:hypothetical protein MNBD_ALPHA03-2075 [hydrothermal vent metagenome]|uniref:Uncharacterized protein n=2 Tax=hydrothermal vent metagenome TaxID=652676 RepID=A0A3B1BAG1_9ZZZZ
MDSSMYSNLYFMDRESLADSRIFGLNYGELPLTSMASSIVTKLLNEVEAFSAVVPLRFFLA